MASQGLSYHVDIIFCIDATGSMSSVIEKVKSKALSFDEDLNLKLTEKDKHVDLLRTKVIAYRDFYDTRAKAILESPFFKMPQQRSEYSKFLSGISAEGGGDEPENGLEALSIAMNSEWTKDGDRRRHIVVIFTDASAHKLDYGKKSDNYPQDMPKNFDEFSDLWDEQKGKMEYKSKRMVIFGPDAYPWTDIQTHFKNIIFYPSKAADGLEEIDYKTILDTIANSV